ncbi:MAG: type II toxin-antitoxin system Phd/YefM family antitoxin [Acidobacteria bacterium]|nr:type II toxin-antitoxin system Phd/YefM family antitoxin [Acidobacteriota bacterium]
MITLKASEFKAKCLAILDQVAMTGETVTILKRGKPVARLVPPVPVEDDYPQRRLAGSVAFLGDVVAPALPAEVWEAEGGDLDE